MYKPRRRAGTMLALIAMVTGLNAGVALGGEQAAQSTVKEQHALDLLKGMNDKLADAKSFTFRVNSTVEAPGGTGQFLNFFAASEVAAVRPSKLQVKIRGDAPPFDFYFDGGTMTVYEPIQKLYATTDAPKTIDEMLPFAAKRAGIILPFADALYSNPYAGLTKDLTSAFYAGFSTIRGTKCEHIALAAPGIQWQLWIDAETSLPCLLMGTMLDVRDAPRFSVEFSDWTLDPKLSDVQFTLAKPADAGTMDFRALTHETPGQ